MYEPAIRALIISTVGGALTSAHGNPPPHPILVEMFGRSGPLPRFTTSILQRGGRVIERGGNNLLKTRIGRQSGFIGIRGGFGGLRPTSGAIAMHVGLR